MKVNHSNLFLRNLAFELFRVTQATDVVETNRGVLAWRAPWIAPLCYLVRINKPLSEKDLSHFLTRLPPEFVEQISFLLENFNGLDFLNSIFSVFGMQTDLLERNVFYSMQNTPFDIFALNDFRKPKFAPPEVFLFGALGDGLEDFIDGFDLNGNIVTGKFSQSAEILSKWDNYETWFRNRFELSMNIYDERYVSPTNPLR